MSKQIQIFETSKMTLPEAIEESIASLNEYASRFSHWVAAYSGGKDSTAMVTLVSWAIKTGRVKPPKSFRVLFANTKMEIEPLYLGAVKLMADLNNQGIICQEVVPDIDHRFFVYILGRGLPPPNNGRRYCTRILKVDPMMEAVKELLYKDDIVMFTGVRLGESRSRDERISVSCSRDSGECGQGYFQEAANMTGMPTLAPIVHWRVCNVFDWLYFEKAKHGYDVDGIATVYGDDDIRTGCVACRLVTEDKPLIKVSKMSGWEHLGILQELRDVYDWLERHDNRLIMPIKMTKDGKVNQRSGTVGPLVMKAREVGLEWVKDIQRRAGVELINAEEEKRIRELWVLDTWPYGWTGKEPLADKLMPIVKVITKKEYKLGKIKKTTVGHTIQYPFKKLSNG